MTYFQPPLQADCLKTASMQDRLIHWCHELFSNAENCGNAAITSSDPDNRLLPLSYGTNFISDTLLNAAEELFALNLEETFRGNREETEWSADHHLRRTTEHTPAAVLSIRLTDTFQTYKHAPATRCEHHYWFRQVLLCVSDTHLQSCKIPAGVTGRRMRRSWMGGLWIYVTSDGRNK